jgi:phosphoheptose isomerase
MTRCVSLVDWFEKRSPHCNFAQAIVSSADPVVITAYATDVSYDDTRARWGHADGDPGNVLLATGVSDCSLNVLRDREDDKKNRSSLSSAGGGALLSSFADILHNGPLGKTRKSISDSLRRDRAAHSGAVMIANSQ